jgi:hypothetical protein
MRIDACSRRERQTERRGVACHIAIAGLSLAFGASSLSQDPRSRFKEAEVDGEL